MITVGEPLGKRYVVSKAPEDPVAGVLFEVIDRGAAAVTGQLLADSPVAPEMVGAVGPELLKLRSNTTLLRPRELTLARSRLPVAIIDRPGLVPLRDRVTELTAALGQTATVATLLRWFAAISLDLGRLHEANSTHGAISLRLVITNAHGPLSTCSLSGFGIGAIQRHIDPGTTHSPRSDFVSLLSALQESFIAAGAQPDGGAAAKWMLLRHSAQHGEHPALASGEALSKTLEEFASLATSEPETPSRPSTVPPPTHHRNATLAPPRMGNTSTGQDRQDRSGPRPPSNPRRSQSPARGPAPTSPQPQRPAFRRSTLFATAFLVCASVGVVSFVYLQRERPHDSGPMTSVRLRPRNRTAIQCPREQQNQLQTLSVGTPIGDLDAVCARDDQLIVAWRSGTNIKAARRSSARGMPLDQYTPASVRAAVELGPLLSTPDGVWAAWRNGLGAPLEFSRVDVNNAIPRPVRLSGWDDVPLRGVWPLKVTPTVAFAIVNVVSEGGAHAVLVEASMGPGSTRPPAITWYLGPGAVRAAIPGDVSTLLFHQRVAPATGTGPARHAFNIARINLDAITSQRVPGAPTTIRGASLPDALTRRSPTTFLDGEDLTVVSRGITAPEHYQSFALTLGQHTLPDACPAPNRCVSPGVVWVLAFPDQGDAVPIPAARDSLAESLISDNGNLRVLTFTPGNATHPSQRHLVTLPNPLAPPSSPGDTLDGLGLPRGVLLNCGPEPWVIIDDGPENPTLTAAPAACLGTR